MRVLTFSKAKKRKKEPLRREKAPADYGAANYTRGGDWHGIIRPDNSSDVRIGKLGAGRYLISQKNNSKGIKIKDKSVVNNLIWESPNFVSVLAKTKKYHTSSSEIQLDTRTKSELSKQKQNRIIVHKSTNSVCAIRDDDEVNSASDISEGGNNFLVLPNRFITMDSAGRLVAAPKQKTEAQKREGEDVSSTTIYGNEKENITVKETPDTDLRNSPVSRYNRGLDLIVQNLKYISTRREAKKYLTSDFISNEEFIKSVKEELDADEVNLIREQFGT